MRLKYQKLTHACLRITRNAGKFIWSFYFCLSYKKHLSSKLIFYFNINSIKNEKSELHQNKTFCVTKVYFCQKILPVTPIYFWKIHICNKTRVSLYQSQSCTSHGTRSRWILHLLIVQNSTSTFLLFDSRYIRDICGAIS